MLIKTQLKPTININLCLSLRTYRKLCYCFLSTHFSFPCFFHSKYPSSKMYSKCLLLLLIVVAAFLIDPSSEDNGRRRRRRPHYRRFKEESDSGRSERTESDEESTEPTPYLVDLASNYDVTERCGDLCLNYTHNCSFTAFTTRYSNVFVMDSKLAPYEIEISTLSKSAQFNMVLSDLFRYNIYQNNDVAAPTSVMSKEHSAVQISTICMSLGSLNYKVTAKPIEMCEGCVLDCTVSDPKILVKNCSDPLDDPSCKLIYFWDLDYTANMNVNFNCRVSNGTASSIRVISDRMKTEMCLATSSSYSDCDYVQLNNDPNLIFSGTGMLIDQTLTGSSLSGKFVTDDDSLRFNGFVLRVRALP